ncbi:MAG: hypothetical protein HN742_38450 [Lentisphaerae bacterium]|jgi:hypothetical protein|nr:hypothetical protein [Lentisphaerota bacterium]MBT4816472.1 hypothetical protein [Lentisphaerota bacterium]MBT5609280.1 hypothetical protein [Lentisphaerota bacterium]MBT7059426.1 hypothetical protein [Lentisphaerota bacterium]MBT7847810.1 hypothetical protein [Lentisphaerota bacterium]
MTRPLTHNAANHDGLALCVLITCLAFLLTATSGAIAAPGITVSKRTMSAAETELAQLPPKSVWKRFSPTVNDAINGLLFLPPSKGGWVFYGRSGDRKKWILLTTRPDGTAIAADHEKLQVIDPGLARIEPKAIVRWWIFPKATVIDFGGHLLFETRKPKGWEFYWINADGLLPPRELYRADLEDGFMRLGFGKEDRWQIHSGTWELKQYGGGMPTTQAEAQSANYRRAANAFTLVGNNGETRYGRETWVNLYTEARFFFGKPHSYAKRDTLVNTVLGGEPVYADKAAIYQSNQIQEYPGSDFFVGHGMPNGYRTSFGWSAKDTCFQLRILTPGSPKWRVLKDWETRPFFGNWTRIGLGVLRGTRLMPFLDGEQLGSYPIAAFIHGPIFLVSGDGPAEADDVAVWSYPKPPKLGSPVFQPSTNFAQKELLERKDKQTGQWTRSELTFEEDEARMRGREMQLKRCQFPIYGDFTYQAGPELPSGEYCLALVNEHEKPYYLGFFKKTKRGWETSSGKPEFELEIGRRKGYLVRRVHGELEVLTSRRTSSTIWLVLGAKSAEALDVQHHRIFSRCLKHDLFQHAPSDWAWREGNFRMDVRWQCQRGWNFMMGKSRDVAVMYSKTAYGGDQQVEFYTALRFVTPPPYYVLRDMGFAFCTDGRSLASGYSLIYGDDDNKTTTLLRNGEPVASASHKIVHKPGANIHNYWWHGKVAKRGKRITVEIDDKIVIDYSDPRPLKGGHLAFWTFRNAISLAKVSVNSEQTKERAELFRQPVRSMPSGRWKPLNVDEVKLKRLGGGGWKATNQAGGGTFATRYNFSGKGSDLRDSPWLHLPLKLDRGTRVGVHLQISGKSFYYPLQAPVQGLRYLLTPEFEKREPVAIYRQLEFTEAQMQEFVVPGRHNSTQVSIDLRGIVRQRKGYRLQSITVGNSSNNGYLLLGAGGNDAGESYVVGQPKLGR